MEEFVQARTKANFSKFILQHCQQCKSIHARRGTCHFIPCIDRKASDTTCKHLTLILFYPNTNRIQKFPLSDCKEIHDSVSIQLLYANQLYINGFISTTGFYFYAIECKEKLTWRKKANSLVNRLYPSLLYYSGQIYSIGGDVGAPSVGCEKYSIATNKWEMLPNLNEGRYRCGCTITPKLTIFLIGGYKFTTLKVNFIDTVEVLRYPFQQWEVVNPKSRPIILRQCPMVFSISDNEIIIAGGLRVDSLTEKCEKLTLFDDGYERQKYPNIQFRSCFMSSVTSKWNSAYSVDTNFTIHRYRIDKGYWIEYSAKLAIMKQ